MAFHGRPPNSASRYVFQGTGLGEDLENYLANAIEERFPGTAIYYKDKCLKSNTTHLVVGRQSSTEKLLSCLASGGRQWILKHDYIGESLRVGKFLPECLFQLKGSESEAQGDCIGSKESRVAEGRRFEGDVVVLLIKEGYFRSQIHRLMVAGGAKILARTINHLLSSFDGEISYIITDPTGYEMTDSNFESYLRLLAENQDKVPFLCPSFIENVLRTSKNSVEKDNFKVDRPEILAFLKDQRQIELRKIPSRVKREGSPTLIPRFHWSKRSQTLKNMPKKRRIESVESDPIAEVRDDPVNDQPLSSMLTSMMEESNDDRCRKEVEKKEKTAAESTKFFDNLILSAQVVSGMQEIAKKAEREAQTKLLYKNLIDKDPSAKAQDNAKTLEIQKAEERKKRIEDTKKSKNPSPPNPEYSSMATDFQNISIKKGKSQTPTSDPMDMEDDYVQRITKLMREKSKGNLAEIQRRYESMKSQEATKSVPRPKPVEIEIVDLASSDSDDSVIEIGHGTDEAMTMSVMSALEEEL